MSGRTRNSEIAYLRDICPELGDLDEEELLLMQESAYLHLKNSHGNNRDAASESSHSHSSLAAVHENSWDKGSIQKQMADDEAIARALAFEDDFNKLHIHDDHDEFHVHDDHDEFHVHDDHDEFHVHDDHDQFNVSAHPNTESTHAHMESSTRSGQGITDGDVNPDTMSYEELTSLGESLGSVSKGLSPNVISRLPSFTYKSGLFSKKKKKNEVDECVICCTGYKNGAKLIALPCAHQYHEKCIKPWLENNKECPICKKEVVD